MRNQYLDVLNLEPGSTERDIKRAYRRLAKQHHPDRSSLPDAEERFVEIATAYRFLTEVGPTPHQESVRYDYDPYAAEYEQRRQEAYEFGQQRAAERYRARIIATQQVNWALNSFVSATLFFQLLLIVDYYLPPQQHTDQVLHITGQRNVTGSFSVIHFRQASLKANHETDYKEIKMIQEGDGVHLYQTPLLSVARWAEFQAGGTSVTILPKYSVYRHYYFLIFIAAILSVVYFALDNSSDNRTLAGIVALMAFLSQLCLF